jgi:hypothetical protein
LSALSHAFLAKPDPSVLATVIAHPMTGLERLLLPASFAFFAFFAVPLFLLILPANACENIDLRCRPTRSMTDRNMTDTRALRTGMLRLCDEAARFTCYQTQLFLEVA